MFSIVFIPNYIKDSLNSNNVEIIQPKVNSDELEIKSNLFFNKHKNLYIRQESVYYL